jgi:hypothetical protein
MDRRTAGTGHHAYTRHRITSCRGGARAGRPGAPLDALVDAMDRPLLGALPRMPVLLLEVHLRRLLSGALLDSALNAAAQPNIGLLLLRLAAAQRQLLLDRARHVTQQP